MSRDEFIRLIEYEKKCQEKDKIEKERLSAQCKLETYAYHLKKTLEELQTVSENCSEVA